jgi:hypothetical protein
MTAPDIVCPKCRNRIGFTDTIAAPLLTEARRRVERELSAQVADLARQHALLRNQQQTLAQTRSAIEAEVDRKLATERAALSRKEALKARRSLDRELARRDHDLATLKRSLARQERTLKANRKTKADLDRQRRALAGARRRLEANAEARIKAAVRSRLKQQVEAQLERRLRRELTAVRTQARTEAEELLRARVSERDIQIAGMRRQIEHLRRKAEQASEQNQGEAFERDILASLRQRFPTDQIVPTEKGRAGADLLQQIRNAAGQLCGSLLWECKRTRAFQPRWLAKLRADQRATKADVALLVTTALPPNVETFALIDRVWVASPRFALPLAALLRQSLIDLANARGAADDLRTKSDLVYRYLTGPRFRQHLDTVLETFVDMQADLDRERRATTRVWAKRETQLAAVITTAATLYGDLQAIAGSAIPQLKALEIAAIEGKSQSVRTD